jgi:predicted ATPase
MVGSPPICRSHATPYGKAVAIPDAVRANVIRRVRSMGRSERAVVMWASVIGFRFDLATLVDALGWDETRVRAALENARLLALVAPGTPEGTDFWFRHALVRDIVYTEFVSTRVRALHRRIARALQRTATSGAAPLAELAYHYWAGGDARRALRYNELAGDNAAALHASADARMLYTRALSLADPDSASYARLEKKIGCVVEPAL